jgi:hypothetical protein
MGPFMMAAVLIDDVGRERILYTRREAKERQGKVSGTWCVRIY